MTPEQRANLDANAETIIRGAAGSSEPPCSAPAPADFIPPWPCQQLHGGRPPYIYQGCDPDTGRCHHEECNPANDDRVPNEEVTL